ncbi:hypothetical protein [Spiroplasma endosymbiont of Polydrusus pterygomalis]|uniref:hypothetical protein n=1 Tax=Spiroplasma endosymbiont of Polydrusus pterygomalis TaxID=3139327 RepID=UPI003CCB3061
MKDTSISKSIVQLLKLVIQIKMAKASNDLSNISFKINDEVANKVDTLAKNVKYKLCIIFNHIIVKK